MCAWSLLAAPLYFYGLAQGAERAEPGKQAAARGMTQATPERELARGKLAYERGDYGAAILALRPLLYPAALLSEEAQLLLAHKLLALAYFFEQDQAGAEQEFNALLSLRPDFALDPLVDPSAVVAFVDNLRRKNEARFSAIQKQKEAEAEQRKKEAALAEKREAERRRREAPRVYIERLVYRRFSLLSLVPFGVPQLVDGRKTLGGLLLAGEVAFGGASLGTWIAVRVRYPDGRYPASDSRTATALTYTYLISGVAFWGLCTVGLIDALYHAKTQVKIRELPGPPQPNKPAAFLRRLTLYPHVVPGPERQVGLSLGGSF